MTEIYLHIVARMADYMATHPYIYATPTEIPDQSWRSRLFPRSIIAGLVLTTCHLKAAYGDAMLPHAYHNGRNGLHTRATWHAHTTPAPERAWASP